MNLAEITQNMMAELSKMVRTDSVVGKPIQAGKSTVIPVSRVSFGFGSGGGTLQKEKREPDEGAAMGGGATIEPIAFIVITEDKAQLLSVTGKEGLTLGKVFDLIPDLISHVKDWKGGKGESGKSGQKTEKKEEK